MTTSGDTIFSKPRYRTVASVQPARRRLVVAQDAVFAVPLLGDPASTQLLSLGEKRLAGVAQEHLADAAALRLRLQRLLEQAVVGTRLCAVGDEAFLWDIYRLARQTGLLDIEIELFQSGARRRLYCVHCATFQDIDEQSEACCSGCGVRLSVREHFSSRLGAYLGVCLDPSFPYGGVRP